MSISRTVEINDLTPRELATIFTDMSGDKQAEFFAAVWDIALEWPGAGWCKQSHDIARYAPMNPGARDAVTTLAAHFSEESEA